MTDAQPILLRLTDGYECFARLWLPERPRGGILYLHGIQSHGGWFESSAARLAESGYAVLLPDRRGSGRNQEDRGHAASARRLLQDCVEWMNELQQRTGDARAHVVGVSWGGKLALALWRFAPARIRSLTLVAPGLFPQVDLPLREKVRVGLSILAAPRALFNIPLNDPEMFTANPARQQFIREDPLKLTQVTTSFLMASRRLDRYALSARHDARGCPLRVLLAGQDRIIDNERTRDYVRRLRWLRRAIVEYPQAHHTLEFERDPGTYFRDLIEWVGSQAPGEESGRKA
jgi:alpha-beta hydrolase superfamily lysophospholipase